MSESRDVGPLGEEAAKLLGAFSSWARDHTAEASDGVTDLADRAATAVLGIDTHLSTGAAECTVCPLCRTIHAIRQVNPEVTTHLRAAFVSLAEAATALLDTAPPRDVEAGVDDVTVDDEWPEEPDRV